MTSVSSTSNQCEKYNAKISFLINNIIVKQENHTTLIVQSLSYESLAEIIKNSNAASVARFIKFWMALFPFFNKQFHIELIA